MTNVRPLGDRVLVRVVGRERVTTGGVVLPDNVREESDRGLVLAVGPGTPFESRFDGRGVEMREAVERFRPLPVEVNEVVLFSPYAGSKVAVGSDNYLLLREHDVLGVLEGVEIVEDENGELRIREVEAAVA